MKAGKWKEADQETTRLILKVANMEQESYLDAARIQNFPCEVMSKIDRLWVDSSGGKFGFSVQKKIYVESCGGTADGQYDETYEKAISCFTTRVGWCGKDLCRPYSDLTFNTQAPSGHFPTFVYEKGDTSWVESLSAIIANCNL